MSPVLAFGFLGPRQHLTEVCTIFKVCLLKCIFEFPFLLSGKLHAWTNLIYTGTNLRDCKDFGQNVPSVPRRIKKFSYFANAKIISHLITNPTARMWCGVQYALSAANALPSERRITADLYIIYC